MKIEQSLLDKFIATFTPLLTPEQVTQYITGITLADITMDAAVYDGNAVFKRRATVSCKPRKWRARRTLWVASALASVIRPQSVYPGTLAQYLDVAGTVSGGFVYPPTDTGGGNVFILPYTEGQTYNENTILSLLGVYTPYDFSDFGTIKKADGTAAHKLEIITEENVDNDLLFDTSLQNRIKVQVNITGPVIAGSLYFLKDDYFEMGNDKDLGTILS